MSGVMRRLIVAASPHLRGPVATPVIMWNVVASLVPLVAAATYFFGPSALLVISAAALGAVATEHIFGKGSTVSDGSAAITGVLLGLTLPAGFPLWMVVIGSAFAIGIGKLLFGGLGSNVFNPALLGRAFLQAAFPGAITTWPRFEGPWWALRGDNFAFPFAHPVTDAVTAATPLGLMKFETKPTALMDLMLGSTGGSLGETAGVLILVCGAYLAVRNFLNWRIPVAVLGSVVLFAGLLHMVDAARYASPAFELFAGGLMLGAVFMATDPVTAPVTNGGRWIFGVGVGVLVVIIRTWGGLPEGVMYAVLLMNALTPFINQLTQPRVFGTARARVVV